MSSYLIRVQHIMLSHILFLPCIFLQITLVHCIYFMYSHIYSYILHLLIIILACVHLYTLTNYICSPYFLHVFTYIPLKITWPFVIFVHPISCIVFILLSLILMWSFFAAGVLSLLDEPEPQLKVNYN